MKKDLLSFKEHDIQYIKSDTNCFKKTLKQTREDNTFETAGFKKAFSMPNKAKVHIDIGSGGGWLVIKTSDLFDKVIGIEPSKTAVENAEKLIKESNIKNIKLINKDMIDGILGLDISEPSFFTTSTVLSHIKDYYVKEFLKLLNEVPKDSVLYFAENYDKNLQQKLWHIRRKYWWAKNLSEWQLDFFDLEIDGYKSGIYGVKVGEKNVINKYIPTFKENISWFFDGIKNKISRIIRNLKRKFK